MCTSPQCLWHCDLQIRDLELAILRPLWLSMITHQLPPHPRSKWLVLKLCTLGFQCVRSSAQALLKLLSTLIVPRKAELITSDQHGKEPP